MLKRRVTSILVFCLVLIPLAQLNASADTLGTADSFAVLAGTEVTNITNPAHGLTVITGDLGVSPSAPNLVTGFPPGTVTGTIYTYPNAVVGGAKTDLTTAFTALSPLSDPPTATIPGGLLDGLHLGPGVYSVSAPPSNLTGTLYLNDGGVNGSIFVFQMSSSLITSPGAVVDVSGLLPSDSLFWVVDSSATLDVDTTFYGNILAYASITFDPGATDLCGRALAETGEVTFAGQAEPSKTQNAVSIGCTNTYGYGGGGFNGNPPVPPVTTPEPGTLPLLGSGFAGLVGMARMTRAKAWTRSAKSRC